MPLMMNTCRPSGANWTNKLPRHSSPRQIGHPRRSRPLGRPKAPQKLLNHAAALPELLAFVPQVCFTQECQQQADKEFLTFVVFPGLAATAGLIALLLRPPPSGDQYFQDPDTQMVFEVPKDAEVGRDKKGELIYKVTSYTPYPCEEDVAGERVRIDVGTLGKAQPRTFVFEKLLPGPSELVQVTLPRPLGIVFEEDSRRGRAVVVEFVPDSLADRERKKAKLDKRREGSCAIEGDVLRAVTCTTLMYETLSMFGAAKPTPTISLYGADGQKWPQVTAALKRGSVSDGPVTLILERRGAAYSDDPPKQGRP